MTNQNESRLEKPNRNEGREITLPINIKPELIINWNEGRKVMKKDERKGCIDPVSYTANVCMFLNNTSCATFAMLKTERMSGQYYLVQVWGVQSCS